MSPSLILALTTEANTETAEALARVLLERRLAACVALRQQRALYWWQGQIEDSAEVELLIKTTREQQQALEAAVHEHHSYETPEWIVWSAEASPGYGAWAEAACRPS